eukprot:gene43869-53641_t
MWNAAGVNQQWSFISTGEADTFYLKASCGKYLSYPDDCSNTKTIDLWSQAGVNQKFRFVKGNNGAFDYYIEAVGRSNCEYRYLSFPGPCTTSSPDHVDFWSAAGENQRFRLYPVGSQNPLVQAVSSSFSCPDPYVWKPRGQSGYKIQCTEGGLKLGSSPDLQPGSVFKYEGDCLGGSPPGWAAADQRWAPDNFESSDAQYNYMFFGDAQPDGKHRIGYAVSKAGPAPGAYSSYSSTFLDLGGAAGGDIDSTVFEDSDGKTYLIWKTDDNNVGSPTTRIFLQQISLANGTVAQLSSPRQILDSTGLWWVDSWVQGGSLVEGPEMIKRNGMYYLFFAAGRYCQDSYTEGVARSSSLFGPYEKLASPLLANGIVGRGRRADGSTDQLVGPGHASIVPYGSGEYRIVYHASIGAACNRYAFINKLAFTPDGWPYVDF